MGLKQGALQGTGSVLTPLHCRAHQSDQKSFFPAAPLGGARVGPLASAYQVGLNLGVALQPITLIGRFKHNHVDVTPQNRGVLGGCMGV